MKSLIPRRCFVSKKKTSINFTNNYNFKIEEANSAIAGFGESVHKITGLYSGKTKCYVNEHNKIYFPNPISVIDLKDLVIFLNDFCESQDAKNAV